MKFFKILIIKFAILLTNLLIKTLGFTNTIKIARKIGTIIPFFLRREVQIIKLQTKFASKKSKKEILTDPKIIFANIAECFVETLILSKYGISKFKFELDGLHHFEENKHNGILACSAHYGPFEIIAAYFGLHGYQLNAVAKDLQYSQDYLNKTRQTYMKASIWRFDPGGARKVMRALKDKELVSILIDQDTTVTSKFEDFFGYPASYPSGLIDIANRLEITVLIAFIKRVDHLTYKIIVKKTDNLISEYHHHLEELIRTDPNQWIWWHKRWRTQNDIDYRAHPELVMNTKNYVKWLKSQIKGNE